MAGRRQGFTTRGGGYALLPLLFTGKASSLRDANESKILRLFWRQPQQTCKKTAEEACLCTLHWGGEGAQLTGHQDGSFSRRRNKPSYPPPDILQRVRFSSRRHPPPPPVVAEVSRIEGAVYFLRHHNFNHLSGNLPPHSEIKTLADPRREVQVVTRSRWGVWCGYCRHQQRGKFGAGDWISSASIPDTGIPCIF